MSDAPQYQDGQIVNGWRFDAASNSWVQAQPYAGMTEPIQNYQPAKSTPWGKIIGFGAVGVIGLLVLVGGCGAALIASDSTPAPEPAAAQPAPIQPPPVQPAPVQPAPNYNPEPQTSEKDAYLLLLESAWDKQGISGQRAICDGWALGFDFQETVLDQFEASISGTPLTRSDVRNFFNSKC